MRRKASEHCRIRTSGGLWLSNRIHTMLEGRIALDESVFYVDE
jgi:hypothetical protein